MSKDLSQFNEVSPVKGLWRDFMESKLQHMAEGAASIQPSAGTPTAKGGRSLPPRRA